MVVDGEDNQHLSISESHSPLLQTEVVPAPPPSPKKIPPPQVPEIEVTTLVHTEVTPAPTVFVHGAKDDAHGQLIPPVPAPLSVSPVTSTTLAENNTACDDGVIGATSSDVPHLQHSEDIASHLPVPPPLSPTTATPTLRVDVLDPPLSDASLPMTSAFQLPLPIHAPDPLQVVEPPCLAAPADHSLPFPVSLYPFSLFHLFTLFSHFFMFLYSHSFLLFQAIEHVHDSALIDADSALICMPSQLVHAAIPDDPPASPPIASSSDQHDADSAQLWRVHHRGVVHARSTSQPPTSSQSHHVIEAPSASVPPPSPRPFPPVSVPS